MLKQELQRLPTDPASLRRFGYWIGGAAALAGGLLIARYAAIGAALLVAGAALIAFGRFAPRRLRAVYLAWMSAGILLGRVMSALLLTLFFYLILTPYGLALRAMGMDFLSRKKDAGAESYWIKRSAPRPRPPEDYERQY
jgi:hypothetical protein